MSKINWNGFSNFDTDHTVTIIMNDFNLYQKRKSFSNAKEFEHFFSRRREIYSFVTINAVDFDEVFNFFQLESN
jgi:Zn-dependent peptidase ImmA (M78 family)